MVDLLYDAAVVNAAKGSNIKVLENNGVFPEKYIFEKHGIDSLQFVTSNEYYSYNPEIYKGIYLKVLDRLEAEKAIHQKVLDAEKKVNDSLSELKKKEEDSIAKIRKQTRDSISKTALESEIKDTILNIENAKDLLKKIEQ